jgi:hypothetical protein
MAVTQVKLLRYEPSIGAPDFALVQPVEAGNYSTNGDTVNLNPGSWTDPNGIGILGEPTNLPSLPVAIDSEAIGGYYAQWSAGTTLGNGKLVLYQPGGAQVAAGAVPAAISGGTIVLRVPLR